MRLNFVNSFMNQHFCGRLFILCFLGTSLPAQTITHQLFDSNNGTRLDATSGLVGTRFRSTESTNRLVTHLGYYDSGGDGLAISHRVGLFAATSDGSGAVLAEVTVPAGTNALLENEFRWVALPAPYSLATNTDYVLAAEVTSGSGDPFPGATTRAWNRFYVGYTAANTRSARLGTNAWPHEPETLMGNSSGYGAANLGLSLSPQPCRIMPLGDSITAGYTDNPVWNVPFEFGYRSKLFQLLSSNGIPVQFVGASLEPWNGLFGLPKNKPDPDLRPLAQDQHEGYGGQGTAYVLQNIAAWLTNDRPDIILMMIGINDIGAGQTSAPASVQTALSNIVQRIVTLRPQTHVIIAQIMPYATYTPALQEYNDYIRDVLTPAFAARGFRVSTVDQSVNFVTDPAGFHPDPALYANGINHPSATAYARMAQTWFAGILKVLSGGPSVIITNPPASREASLGALVPIAAKTFPGSGGPAVRLQLLVNGVPQSEVQGAALNMDWLIPALGTHQVTVKAFDALGRSGESSVCVFGADPQAGPGGVTNGLQVWLKAETGIEFGNGKSVKRWGDQSGHAHDALQTSPTPQPKLVEGLFGPGPGLRFDGSRLLTSTNGMPTHSYSKVVRFFLGGTNMANHLVSSPVAGSAALRGHALYFGTAKQQLKLSHNGDFAQASTNVAIGEPVVAIATYDAATQLGEIYLENVLAGTGNALGDNTVGGYQLGALAGGSRLLGVLSEIMIYDRVLTPADRQDLLDYFRDKYRAPFNLWQTRYFSPEDPRSAPEADASGDGLANAVKYALGLTPLSSNIGSDHLPRASLLSDQLEVRYRRSTEASDILVYLESSPDLRNWTPLTDVSQGMDGSLETRSYTVPGPLTGGLFFRLRVAFP